MSFKSLFSRPIYGLIFLFKWQQEADDRAPDPDADSRGVFFANQVINNACATQAIISILMNIPSDCQGFDLGNELSQLREFTRDFDPQMRGLAIGNSEVIRTIHNSFHPPQPLLPEEKDDDNDGEAFHFIAYVPAAGGLYELDGLKPGPIRICDCTHEEWLKHAATAVTERIARYAATEQRFNLMAIIRNRQDIFRERLAEKQACILDLKKDKQREDDVVKEEMQVEEIQAALANEEEKRRRWHSENVRRRTDYTPFAFQLLKQLGAMGKLDTLVRQAEESKRQKTTL